MANVEALFANLDADELKAAADLIDNARQASICGVGTAKTLADNFAYVASMAVDNITAIPSVGLAIDDVVRMTADDVLVAMTFSPYRSEIVEAVKDGRSAGRADHRRHRQPRLAPIIPMATHAFVVPNDSPLPFSSNVAATALLETLLAFVVAESPDRRGHRDRHLPPQPPGRRHLPLR